jgi:protoporphyrinogen oxidase
MREIVIVGGGVTGLAAAWELERLGQPYRLIEVKGRLGGSIGSVNVDGFVLESGVSWLEADADTGFLAELGLNDALVTTDHPGGKQFFREGVQTLVDALSARLTRPVMRRMAVSSLGPLGENRYGVCLENGVMLDASGLIITAPAIYAEHMLRSLQPEAAFRLFEYRYDCIARVHLGYRLEDVTLPDGPPPPDYAITDWRWTTHPSRVPPEHVLIEVSLRLPVEDEVPPQLALQLAATLQWPLNPVVQHVDYWHTAHPLTAQQPDHATTIDTIDRLLPRGVVLAGSDYRAFRLDERIAHGRNAARQVAAALQR